MRIDQAREEVQRRFCSPMSRAVAWITPYSKKCAVGVIMEGHRYTLGIGDTWEEAIKKAETNCGEE